MAAVKAINSANFLGESVSEPQTIEQQALDFFRRADMCDSPNTPNDWNGSGESARPPQIVEQQALDFFWRAELSAALETIWTLIKRQRFSTLLKLIKAVALITAVILFSQSVSFAGIFALVGALAGLLFAAITNALAWLMYIPLYFVAPSDFASSALLAIGLAWLVGISPFVALIIRPIMLFGFRLAEHVDMAHARISEAPQAVGTIVKEVNLGAAFQQAAGNFARFVGSVPKGIANTALVAKKLSLAV